MNTKPRRMAYVCADPGVPVFGSKGCSIHVQEVLREFVKRGVCVDLYAARVGGENPWDEGQVRCVPIPIRATSDLRGREHALMEADEVLGALLRAVGSYDLVYERHSLWATRGMRYALECGVPGVLEVNAPLVEEQWKHRGLVEVELARAMVQSSYQSARSVVAVSEEVAAHVRECCPGQAKVHVISNGVNPDRFGGIRGAEEGGDGGVTVGFVGTLKPWHGVEVLVDAFRMMREKVVDARLLIVGDGPERGRLEALLKCEMGEGVCQFTGLVSPEAIPDWIGRMDIAVAPYPELDHFYFSPLKVYEYMAARRAVVASSVGQLREILEQDVNGVLCSPGDVAGLAGQLVRLAGDGALRWRLGEAALETVRARHTWTCVVDRILATVGWGEGSEVCAVAGVSGGRDWRVET